MHTNDPARRRGPSQSSARTSAGVGSARRPTYAAHCMDSLADRTRPTEEQTESSNLRLIRGAFEVSESEGFMAGLEAILKFAREDCKFRPYIASGHIISGHDAIRAFYRAAMNAGTDMRLRGSSFHEEGDSVIVRGTMRVGRPSGGFSESQITWTYRFRDGRLAEASWSPRRPA
jgi:ketosteroid isomerase-like protein